MSGNLTPEQIAEQSFLDAEDGLLPKLTAGLGENFDRFQIRPWSFNGIFEGSGYKIIRPAHTQNKGTVNNELSVTCRVGFLMQIADETRAEIEGLKLAITMDRIIFNWAKCSRYVQSLDFIDGFNDAKQDKNFNSGEAGAWYTVVVREFTISYEFFL